MKTTKERTTKSRETTQLITFLYCESIPKEPMHCVSKKCMDGQCLCMDTEQLGLLLSRMFDDKEWNPPCNLTDSKFVHVLTNEEEEKVRCQQQEIPDSVIRLIKCRKGRIDYTKMQAVMKKAAPEKIRSLLKMLPIIKMTNVTHKFNDRYSFVYICTFGDYAANFIERFMAMMIGHLVERYILDKDVVPILEKMEFFYESLFYVNTGRVYEECAKELVEQIESYYDTMVDSNKEVFSSCAEFMWDFRKTINETKENHKDPEDIVELLYPDDEVEFVHLCHLLKTILDLIEIDYGFKVGNLQTYMNVKSECRHDFYDKLESMLISEKGSDIVRKKYVFSMLKKMFDNYGSWADEDLIQLEQSISN